ACGGATLSGFGLADVGNGGGPAVDCERTSSTNGAVNCCEHCGQRTSEPRSWSGTCTCVEHPGQAMAIGTVTSPGRGQLTLVHGASTAGSSYRRYSLVECRDLSP